MLGGVCKRVGLLFLLAIGFAAGCSTTTLPDIDGPRTPGLFFGDHPSTHLATQIGRSTWPSTYGHVESVQHTVFIEYYRDHQGHQFLERNNPRRLFRSYRVGTQFR